MNLTKAILDSLLSYDAESGSFTWIKTGALAGSQRPRGSRQIGISRKIYLEHRLAWLHHYGEWPVNEVDHIDGDPSNNRISNLRDVSHRLNQQNQRRANRDSRIGMLGVSTANSKFIAAIHVGGKRLHLGRFITPEAAHQAYVAAKRQLHEGNTL
jgi:hypothetical protein